MDVYISMICPSNGNTRCMYIRSVLSRALSHATYQKINRRPRGYDRAKCVAYANEKKAY